MKVLFLFAAFAASSLAAVASNERSYPPLLMDKRQSCPECPDLKAIGANCECVCNPVMCSSPKTQDPDTCLCVCPTTACSNGGTRNPDTCACECPTTTCSNGGTRNPDTCQCECPTAACSNGGTRNPDTCQCECPTAACSNGGTRNPDTCACECTTACVGGQTRDADTCACLCNLSCTGLKKILNQNTCQCECPSTACPGKKTRDPTTCQCSCPLVARCRVNEDFDQNSCSCKPKRCGRNLPACPYGYNCRSGCCEPHKNTPVPLSCGGISGKSCPSGYDCVDNPNDTCDPRRGGRDCPSICKKRY